MERHTHTETVTAIIMNWDLVFPMAEVTMETAMEIMEEALMVPVPVQLPAEECILL